MTHAERIAEFAIHCRFEDLSQAACEQLKIRVLDALGCAIGAIEGLPVRILRAHLAGFEGEGPCMLIGGRRVSPSAAAFYNGALVRYLDFNDSYLAKGETCHPSDNVVAVLAASEYSGASGRDFLTALAVAYQVQCRLSEVAPVRAAGFDHTVQGSYAIAAGVSRALGLGREEAANAIAICGTAFNALRVTRTGKLSHWKGLAYPHMAAGCTNATFLAMHGITGPLEAIEGEKGFMDAISGMFEIDWEREDLESVRKTSLKKYNAEIHSQSTIDAALALKRQHQIQADQIEKIEVEIFDVAYHIIGGGDEGDKTIVATKEQADHSLPYLIAVALLDGTVMPEQYAAERIGREDVQGLLHRVTVLPNEDFSNQFPEAMPCRVTIALRDGRTCSETARDYPGFFRRPMSWEETFQKFERLTEPYAISQLRRSIADTVKSLDAIPVSDLTRLFGDVGVVVTRSSPAACPCGRSDTHAA
ncbi:MAG TPA: MmgE/PrpD family protein [Candidatus Dormibacteraeota bacterium]|nr:MmgE/PrpD family protein [Candidatus Dormibacteraeota bacterium]